MADDGAPDEVDNRQGLPDDQVREEQRADYEISWLKHKEMFYIDTEENPEFAKLAREGVFVGGHDQRVQKESAPDEPAPKEPAPKEPAPKGPVPKEPAPEEPAPKGPAPEEPAPNGPAPNELAPKEPAPKEPAPKELAPKEPAPKEPAPKEPALRPPTPRRQREDNPDYARVDFTGRDPNASYISFGVGGLLKSSPAALDDPNQLDYLGHLQLPARGQQHVVSTTRKQFQNVMLPMIAVETLAQMSEDFKSSPLMTRKIWKEQRFTWLNDAGAASTRTFKFKFRTSDAAAKQYQHKCSKSVWLLHSIADSPTKTNIKSSLSFLGERCVMVFVNSFKGQRTRQAARECPQWPSFDGKHLPIDAPERVFELTCYLEETDGNREWLSTIERSPEAYLTFVSQITMHARFARMMSIPELPANIDPFNDYNVSPVYDCIIGIRPFDIDYCLATDSLEEKFGKFCAPEPEDRINHSKKPKLNLVVGVPGSGKTSNTAGPVGNYIIANKHERVMVCAPSNAACDVFFIKIKHSFPEILIARMGNPHNFTRNGRQAMNDALRKFKTSILSNQAKKAQIAEKYALDEDQLHEADFEMIWFGEAQIVVCTLGSSQCDELITIREHAKFSTLIVDECTQAQLVELLLPLHLTSIERVMLIGDPFQLGPVCTSKIFASLALERCSLFINLFARYGTHPCTSKLTHQYRLHPVVAKLIWNISYRANDVAITADPAGKYMKLRGILPPLLVFSSDEWKDAQPDNTHSRISFKEVETGMQLLKASLRAAGFDFNTMQFPEGVPKLTFAIIPLYRGQVRLFEQKIEAERLHGVVNVYTVDQMQGSECDVAIVSAVRATTGNEVSVGFASDIRRLNVALSRAGAVFVLAQAKSFGNRQGWAKLYQLANFLNLFHGKAETLYDVSGDPSQQFMTNFLRLCGQKDYDLPETIPGFDPAQETE